MAINVGTAIAFLDLDTSRFTSGLASAGASLRDFATNGSIQSLSDSMASAGSTLTKAVTLPIAGIGAAAVKATSDFDTSMSKVAAISGATGDDFTSLREEAIKLGADTNFSASEAADGMENLASAGFKTNEILTAMPGMLSLAAAGGVSIADASDIASTSLRSFNLDASQSSHVADVLAKAAGDTNAEIMDTGEAMKYIAPVANSLGISLEDTTAAIGMMSNAGIKGSQAGTTLRAALTNLASPTKGAYTTMKTLGMEFFDASGKMKPMGDIIQILQDKTAGLTQQQKASTFETLFGKEAMSGMLALVSQGPDAFNELTNSLKNCDGASDEMAKTMQDNIGGSIEALKGSIETAAIRIGDVLAPSIRSLAGWLSDLINKFSALPRPVQEFIVKAGLIAAAIGPVLIIMAKLIESVRTVISVFSGITRIASIVSALPGLLTGPVGAVVLIIGLIALVVYEIYEHWDGLKAYFSNLWEWLKGIFSGFWQWLQNFFSQWGPVILAIIAPFLGIPLIIWQHWGQISEWFEGIAAVVSNVVAEIGQWFEDGVNNWIAKWDSFVDYMKNIGSYLWQGLVGGLEAGWDWVKEKMGGLADKVKELWQSAFGIHSPSRVFMSYGQYMGQGLVMGLDNEEGNITTKFSNLGNKIKGLVDTKNTAMKGIGNSSIGQSAFNNTSVSNSNTSKVFQLNPVIHMNVSIADTGNKGTAQLTNELKGMSKVAIKNGMIDQFMSDALRL